MKEHKIYSMSFASIYPLYINKAMKKGRTQSEVDEIIFWLTGYDQSQLSHIIETKINIRSFFDNAPYLNPLRHTITGAICGVKITEIDEPIMKEIRYLDKLIDELAKGKTMEKILRK